MTELFRHGRPGHHIIRDFASTRAPILARTSRTPSNVVASTLSSTRCTWRRYAAPLHCSAKPARPCPLAAPPGARRATEASDGREADAAPARRSRSKSSTRSRAPPRRPPRARPTARARACPRPPESTRTRCTVCRWRRTARGPLALDKQYARDRVRCRAARPDRASPPARDRACPYTARLGPPALLACVL